MIAHTKNINYEYVNQGAAVSRSVFNKSQADENNEVGHNVDAYGGVSLVVCPRVRRVFS